MPKKTTENRGWMWYHNTGPHKFIPSLLSVKLYVEGAYGSACRQTSAGRKSTQKIWYSWCRKGQYFTSSLSLILRLWCDRLREGYIACRWKLLKNSCLIVELNLLVVQFERHWGGRSKQAGRNGEKAVRNLPCGKHWPIAGQFGAVRRESNRKTWNTESYSS